MMLLAVAGFFVAGIIATNAFQTAFTKALDQLVSRTELPQETATSQLSSSEYVSRNSYEQAIIEAVKEATSSVVSIIVSKNLPVYEKQFINPFGEMPGFNIQIPQYVQRGTELKEVGSGSGFIVSEDGMLVTNKHVVVDEKAQYTVIDSNGKKYPAKILAIDPVQDLAIAKIESGQKFKPIKLGDSTGIQIGQGAIAIGNALGKFSNTVSVGVVSGLGRTISASDQSGSFSETLEGIIQTDAAINFGNSGGPLINLKGEVIGVNVATAQGAQTIGFAIPINLAKRGIAQVTASNKIVYPFLGVRYALVNEELKKKYGILADYGAILIEGANGQAAVAKNSAAAKAGLKEKDVILEVNGQKITENVSLASLIQKYNPGDTVTLKVLRGAEELEIKVTLGERS